MRLAIYETNHHENLPALLDLAEASAEKTAVFLTELSYRNLSPNGRPENTWSNTLFYVQTGNIPHRAFIDKLIRFIRENEYSHLHLSTLDNNLLFFAVRLLTVKKLHISLTVHEINEYLSVKFGNIRDFSESLAKGIFRRRIRSYHFFLPAMVSSFQKRLPGSVGVFIPSRFYSPPSLSERRTNDPFRIVIPGSIDPSRRDYRFVLSFLRKWLSDYSGKRIIELTLLGNSNTEYGREIIAGLRQLESPLFLSQHFSNYIPGTEYECRMQEADLIWSPLKVKKFGIRNTPEVCGETTASGLTADILLQSSPALVPADFTIPEEFNTALLPYHSPEELSKLLYRFMDDPSQGEEQREKIQDSFSLFTKERFTPAFRELLGLNARMDG